MKTIYLAGPIILRTREDDPQGQPPIDQFGQPAKNRDGSPAKAFKIVETHLKAGVNVVEDAVADHPYTKAHTKSAPRGTHDDFTVEQLEAMLAAKRAKLLAGAKPEDAKPAPQAGARGNAQDDLKALPMPSDDVIKAMQPAELRGFLNANGGSDRGVANADLVAAALNLKAKAPK